MRLNATRRHWNRFAQRDPFWAVLTEPDKAHGRWTPEAFFQTGETAIAQELAWVRGHLPTLAMNRALDFGCGVGRLTQALAQHFQHVTGVDVAEEMLALAHRHNRAGERVTFCHNTAPDLRTFATGGFDYITSDITLQHMAPRYARQYIAEFVRVGAPGGAVTFQIPSYVPPEPKERFKFSWYWPTLWTRIRRFSRRAWQNWVPPEPVMEVYAIPRDEVVELLTQAGARVLEVVRNSAAGARIESYRYLATKPS